MEVTVKAKYIKMSPKKMRLVSNVIKGMIVTESLDQLKFIPKAATKPLIKLVNSGIAAAENDFKLKKDNLYIKNILVNEGPTLHRWQPRAFGRATPIRKRSSNITLILSELVEEKKDKKVKEKKKAKEKLQVVDSLKSLPGREDVAQDKKPAKGIEREKDKEIVDVRIEGKHRHKQHLDKREEKGSKGFLKKIFNRKVG